MTLTQSQLLAMSGRLLTEARRYSEQAKPGTEAFFPNHIISCVLSSVAVSLHAAYDAGKAGLASEERQHEGK